jgi:glycosyltransferase involved in cell wall biosynthesis
MLIDVTRLLGRFNKGRLPTGVDRVCLAYIRQYGASARVFLYNGGCGWVLSHRASQDLFALLLEPVEAFFRTAACIMAKSPLLPLPKWKSAGCLLFNIGHSGLERPGYARWLMSKQVRPIFMVHDLIPITHHEFCRCGEHERHTARMQNVLKTAAGIVTNSQATLEALSAFADASGCALPPTIAAPLGSAPFLHIPGPRPIPEPYFVMLGTIEPRKNHWMALQVWRRLVERHGGAVPRLVVIGQRGWECENVLDLLERCDLLRGVVTELTNCSDAALVTYLHHAQALVFPSFVEGYGLPLIEALSLGVPVIAGDLPVFREIAGDVPEYLDPLDGMGWMTCIEDYRLPESPRRAAQLQRMSRFTPPTWHSHFEILETMLEQLT